MIKAVMVDVDGVLIVHPDQRGWSANLEQDLGLPVVRLQEAFFSQHWDDVVHGRAGLRERLEPVLRDIAPNLTCEALIDYWFSHDAHIDEDLLDELMLIRSSGTEIHLATVQDHERANYLWDVLGFRSRFDGLHYAAALGYSKPVPAFYRAVEARTGFKPEELFFIDDKEVNVEAAVGSGWNAALWSGKETLRSLLRSRGFL